MPGLSPFTQEILRFAWEQLFDSSSSFFLPDMMRTGVPSRGIPSLDPLWYAGPSPALTVAVDDDVRDSACASPGSDPNPIAVSQPVLQVRDARISGLYAVRSGPELLTFSTTAPEVTATLNSGELRGKPLPLIVDTTAGANYGFAVDCCIPASPDSRKCGGTRWTASAHGRFKASVSQATIRATLRVDFPPSGAPPVVTVIRVKTDIEQRYIDIDFDIADLDEDFVNLARQAVEQGIAMDAVANVIQGHLDSSEFKSTLSRILTQQLQAIGAGQSA
jgi:hypothetical protein